MIQRRPDVFLIGDSTIVPEWGELFYRNGWNVSYKLNKGETLSSSPTLYKKAHTARKKTTLAVELTNLSAETKKHNLRSLEKSLSASSVILSSSVTVTATEQCTWMKHPQRLLGICAFPTLLQNRLVELAPTIHTQREYISTAQSLFKKSGKEVSIIQDRVGMVMPRILCMLVNEAMFGLTEGIASPQDIDTAMKLGTNYPAGPVQWGNSIGLKHVLSVIDALYNDLHEERYRAAPLLRLLSTGNQWWKS